MSDEHELSDRPDPGQLLAEAKKELPKYLIRDYGSVIVELREKDYSFRDISRWLAERGLTFDHNEVYREYLRKQEERERFEEDLEEAEDQREEAERQIDEEIQRREVEEQAVERHLRDRRRQDRRNQELSNEREEQD